MPTDRFKLLTKIAAIILMVLWVVIGPTSSGVMALPLFKPTATKPATSPTLTRTPSPLPPSSTPKPSKTPRLATSTPLPTATPVLLFGDDFSSGSFASWAGKSGLGWSIQNGVLQADFGPYADDGWISLSAGNNAWSNYSIDFDVRPISGNSIMTLWLRLKNAESFYVLDLQFHKTNSAGSPQVVLSRSDIGTLAAKKISYAVGNWSTYRVSVKGNRVMVDQLSGSSWKNILDYTDTNTPISSGGLELHAAAYDATPASLQADNFKVLQTNP